VVDNAFGCVCLSVECVHRSRSRSQEQKRHTSMTKYTRSRVVRLRLRGSLVIAMGTPRSNGTKCS